ncbi:MAG: SIMPL domain-containing protein [Xanthobacteraceae bacterium]|nr:SIMPL domain-containing protein [Xanthobacteraceae bacterium]
MRHALAAAAALVALAMVDVAPAPAQPVDRSNVATLTVNGQGRVDVPPDHARLSVEVVTAGANPEAATSAHRERASRATTRLRDMKNDGVSIEQSSFSLGEFRNPERPNTPGRSEYRAVTTFELKIAPAENADKAVTAIAGSGLFEVRNLRFGVDERNPGFDAARRNAVENARRRALTYAEAAGVKLGEIVSINDTDARHPRESVLMSPMARNVQVIAPEALTLTASVTIAWRIAP